MPRYAQNEKYIGNQVNMVMNSMLDDIEYEEKANQFLEGFVKDPSPTPSRSSSLKPPRDNYINKGKIPYDNTHTSGQTSAKAKGTTKAPAVTSPANESTARDSLAFGFGELSGDDKLFVYRKKPPIILSRLD